MYQKFAEVGRKFIPEHLLFKYGFNWSPMYRRSTAKIIHVSTDLKWIRVKLPISYKNRNYVNSIFGGSMFSAVDPIPMVQLINLIGPRYVVWDKAANIHFRRPAKENLYADFNYTDAEIASIIDRVEKENAIEIVKRTELQNKAGDTVFCTVDKTIYVADKAYFKRRRKQRDTVKK